MMSKTDNAPTRRFSVARHDLLASVVVFLVALPLCMGIAIASGAPVAAGLITGIVGGLIVAPLAGAPLQVSGPAAGLTVIVYELIRTHGLEALGIVVLVGGAIQLLAGYFKLGQWFRAVSPAVVHGMLSGIGVLIFASQFHVMVDDKPRENGVQNILTLPSAVAKGLPMPERRTVEEHDVQASFLKRFGLLHERQEELRDLVATRVTHVESNEGERLEAARLASLADRQEQLLTDLRRAAADLSKAGLAGQATPHATQLADMSMKAEADAQLALAALRDDDPQEAEPTQNDALASLAAVLDKLKNHQWAAKMGLLTIALILVWQALPWKWLRVVPAPLVAVAAATLLATWLRLPVLYVEVPDSLVSGIHLPSWSTLQEVQFTALLGTGLMIAVIASAETLLCATAVDQMHDGQRTNYDRELMAQGVGNMTCGVLGGLPMTGVIVRSAANVQAGARSRWSAFMHGVWMLLFVAAFAGALRMIPTASLAGILVYTGYKLVNPKAVKELWHYGKSEVAIYLATVVMIVVEDLLIGVATGIVLSALKLLLNFSHLEAQVQVDEGSELAVLSLRGAATFLRLPILAKELESVPQGAELHVDFQHLDYIDHACLDLLMNWAEQHRSAGGSLVIDWDSLHARFRGAGRDTNGAKGRRRASQPSSATPSDKDASRQVPV